jgi:hypothetical protein
VVTPCRVDRHRVRLLSACGLRRSLTDRYREILDDLDERVIFILDP